MSGIDRNCPCWEYSFARAPHLASRRETSLRSPWPGLAGFGRVSATGPMPVAGISRFWQGFGRQWPTSLAGFGRIWQTFGQCAAIRGRVWPELAGFSPHVAFRGKPIVMTPLFRAEFFFLPNVSRPDYLGDFFIFLSRPPFRPSRSLVLSSHRALLSLRAPSPWASTLRRTKSSCKFPKNSAAFHRSSSSL